MRAHFGGGGNVDGIADGGDKHLRFESIILFVDGADFGNECHAVLADIVQPTNERRNECCPRLGSKNRLRSGKAQRDVDHRTMAGEMFAGLEAIPRHGHFDGDVLGKLGKFFAFADHALGVGGHHFGRNGPWNYGADFFQHFDEVAAGFGHQRRIGGDAVKHAGGGKVADFFNIGGIDKKFHDVHPVRDNDVDDNAREDALATANDALTTQVEVLLPAAVSHGFDYLVPAGMTLAAGDIVSVPFGRGQSLGVVWGKGVAKLDPKKLKAVAALHDFPPLSDAMRQFIDWAAWYYCASKGAMLKMTLPVDEIDKAGRKDVAAHVETHVDVGKITLASLSPAQETAADTLRDCVGKGFSVTLLDGVTGSGKTEVYFKAIAEALKTNAQNQVLVLLPEIGLGVQWLERFEKRFGFTPLMWNSEITPARKRMTWQAIARGEARVVVGARSALFLPYKHLSLLVVDEEHDQSYKQEDGVVYHARDMAVSRARFEKLPITLVSATPSLESYFNTRQGKYREVSLPARHGAAEMPSIEMLDMRKVAVEKDAFISQPLREKLAQTVADGHQAMLFLNRRGFAPLLLCRACGHRFQCPKCSSWLVLHRGRPRLECHHCGYHVPVPESCPECKAEGKLYACGPGIERVHEEVTAFLPKARIRVMASDHTTTMSELTETITDMSEKRIDVLIGTQMIAKGHHFAGLAMVGVVDADLGLAGGDLRAAERTYQLLHQLSGRAGREDVAGTVYLQSFLPEHPVMQALLSGDRDAFLSAELDARKEADMPPFSRLAAVIIEAPKEEQAMRMARALAAAAPEHPKIHLLGPAPAPLFMLRGKFRYRLLLKADRAVNLPDYMRVWLDSVSTPSSVRVKPDMDPISFL